MQETWVRSLSQEDPLGKEMATHSSILAWRIPRTEESGGLLSWRIPRTEESGGLLSMGSQRVWHNWATFIFTVCKMWATSMYCSVQGTEATLYNAYKWNIYARSLSHVWLSVTPWTVACQEPLSVGISRQERWSGLPFPSLTNGAQTLKTVNNYTVPLKHITLYTISYTSVERNGF